MPSLYYNKTLGNYVVKSGNKRYTHATKQTALEQLSAIVRRDKKRKMRNK